MGLQIGSGKWEMGAGGTADMNSLMDMLSGGRTPPVGDQPTLAGAAPSKVAGGGFWEWLGKMGMPPQMQAMIRQDPNLMAQYFEQYRMQMEGGKAQQPGAPGQSASGGDSGGGAPTTKRGPRDPLKPGDIGYIEDGGSINRGFFPSDQNSPLKTPWWNPAKGR